MNNYERMHDGEGLKPECKVCPYFLATRGLPKAQKMMHRALVVIINDFIRDTYDLKGYSKIQAQHLYEKFVLWWRSKNIGPPPTVTLFGRAITTMLPKSKSEGCVVYWGLIPKAEPLELRASPDGNDYWANKGFYSAQVENNADPGSVAPR